MGTKTNPGEFDCYENALPDEPMFVLLGRDPMAPHIVRDWAMKREEDIAVGARPEADRAMVEEARTCARNMEKWRAEHDGEWRDPKWSCDHDWHYVGTDRAGSHKGEDMHKCNKCKTIEYRA